MPQELAIYPSLTARENLEVFARLNGIRAADLRSRVEAPPAARKARPVGILSSRDG